MNQIFIGIIIAVLVAIGATINLVKDLHKAEDEVRKETLDLSHPDAKLIDAKRRRKSAYVFAGALYLIALLVLVFSIWFNLAKKGDAPASVAVDSPRTKPDTVYLPSKPPIVSQPRLRPDLDILPTHDRRNPSARKLAGDTIRFGIGYSNLGTSSATDIHCLYNILASRDGQFAVENNYASFQSAPDQEFHNIKDLLRVDTLTYYDRELLPTDTLYLCAIFCYKNNVHEIDTLKVRIFKWAFGEIESNSYFVSPAEYNSIKTKLLEKKRWPTRYF